MPAPGAGKPRANRLASEDKVDAGTYGISKPCTKNYLIAVCPIFWL